MIGFEHYVSGSEIGLDADDVITWLLTQIIDPMRKGQSHTIATWLKVAGQRPGAARRLFGEDAFAGDADRAKIANRYLAAYGLRVIGSAEAPVLFVATKQMAGLKALFEKSDWAGGAWTQSLQRVPGAAASTTSRYLEGIQTRGLEIPFQSMPSLMVKDTPTRDTPPSWGTRPFAELYTAANALRTLIRQEGSPLIQSAWDEVEPFFDVILARPAPAAPIDGTAPRFDWLNEAHAQALDAMAQEGADHGQH
ncbi:hypothetical protein [Pseudogemmobacter bohemicus]|uniref:hypothetical protein n=1 Tax=Pseudogemmobacter bohemicus TaxID=2250708 RepID=UPI0013005078|nr:hypothetical protein [Pseudogemmobacter bohemicus]